VVPEAAVEEDQVLDLVDQEVHLDPKINDNVPIKKETSVRTFCVIAGTIIIGAPRLVRFCSVTALLSSMHIDEIDDSIVINGNKNNNNVIK
jgi:hypothetical protein